jgi:DNA (cytosine-5)-methyltransferase 1
MLTYLGIADKFKPKWLLWENVPGVLSSNGGEDFACLLKGMAELGYGFAYRVLDAQHFGVPQRRRRVFVIGCLGDWRSAAKVLFESESLCGDITPSRSEKQKVTNVIAPSVANCLQTTCNDYSKADGFNMITHVYETHPADSRVKEMGDVCQTVTSRWGTGGGNVPIALAENTIGRQPQNGGNGNGFTEGGPMYTLNASGVHGVAFQKNTRNEVRYIGGDGQIAGALMAEPGMKQQNYIQQTMRVRRLTPKECERLQGFPDDYTNTPTSSDSTRYKSLGNSMAVPVMKWIGERINKQERGEL